MQQLTTLIESGLKVFKVSIGNIDGNFIGLFEGTTQEQAAQAALKRLIEHHGFFPENRLTPISGARIGRNRWILTTEGGDEHEDDGNTYVVEVHKGSNINSFISTPHY